MPRTNATVEGLDELHRSLKLLGKLHRCPELLGDLRVSLGRPNEFRVSLGRPKEFRASLGRIGSGPLHLRSGRPVLRCLGLAPSGCAKSGAHLRREAVKNGSGLGPMRTGAKQRFDLPSVSRNRRYRTT
jgi:hypothetical protein